MNDFSVLMSIYDKENPTYLHACFESLYSQTMKASEVVLVLDGPIKESLMEVINKWQPLLNMVLVPLQVNVGLGNALNEGLKACSYELVARMDTDDLCLPERFEKQLAIFKDKPSITFCGSFIDEIECESTNYIATRNVKEFNDDIIKNCISRNPFNHISVMFKKSAVMSVGSYKHMMSMEDWYLWLRLLSSGYEGYNIQQTLVKARAGKEMMSRRTGFKYITYEAKLAKQKARLFPQYALKSYFYFIVRSLPRLLPQKLLYLVYLFSRRAN
ncbi:glycosyltransferase [Pseudoalteromonas agarivorans]|uniref:glycosyltransferase n=1 Tax=Pseudoalteromonas TaxID=53246 RepID=UPI000F762D54|nr:MULTISPECIES: glycosyltransferase [Pseudoalteromonas]AZN31570.1 glycosyltransferase [Pseudoalteromonas sp. Xi13]MCQ8822215.1 glycosyltransferase [Pseudoalteromonas agarivorans]